MRRIYSALKVIIISGVVFWAPDIAVHAISKANFSGIDVLVLTILLPIITWVGYVMLCRFWGDGVSRTTIAFWMILGIWIMGPLSMTVSASFSGGGFAKPDAWQLVASGTGLFPLYTFIMSTYDGTLGAVLLITICLAGVGVYEKVYALKQKAHLV